MTKNKRGGKRQGAGRPKNPLKVRRVVVPEDSYNLIKELIKFFRNLNKK